MKKVLLAILLACLTVPIPEVFAWGLERPASHIPIAQRTENSSTDGKASVGLGVDISDYLENSSAFSCSDVVLLRIATTANTRKIISYYAYDDTYYWHDDLPYSVSLGDNEGVWLSIGPCIRFYGGPNSAEYESVWVCSNGFISFDPDSTSTDPYYPYSIPSSAQPNTFIAPFWTDLHPGPSSSITYGIVSHCSGIVWVYCFAISWNNFLDIHGAQQTFQVLIEHAPARGFKHLQSRIWFQYKSVSTSDAVTIGIEDQQGERGASYNFGQSASEKALVFEQTSNSALIGHLTIRLSENETTADTTIDTTPVFIRGYNVVLDQNLPDEEEIFTTTLEGGLTLLIGAYDILRPSLYLAGAGIILDTIFIIVPWARFMARQQKLARLLETDTDNYHTYATAHAVEDPDGIFYSAAVDSSFDILAYWIFNDTAHNQDHNLKITAELTYLEYDFYGNIVASPTISTSVDLTFTADNNNDWDTAKQIEPGDYSRVYLGGNEFSHVIDAEDYYKIWAETGQKFFISMTPPRFDGDFNLYLYNPSRQLKASSELLGNATEYISKVADTEGYWFIKMTRYTGSGFYSFSCNLSIAGDINVDGIVDIFDIVKVAVAFGAEYNPTDGMYWHKPPYGPCQSCPHSPDVDLNGDSIIDIFDVTIIAIHFGESLQLEGLSFGQKSSNSSISGETQTLSGDFTSISVFPSQVTVGKYESFSVNVTVTNATNLYGFEYKLVWNKTLLECTGRELSMPPVWRHWSEEEEKWIDDYTIVKNVIQSNATHQWHWLAITALTPAPAFTGNWAFCEYTFQALAAGTSALSLQAKLCNMEVEAIPVTLVDGSVTVYNRHYMRGDQHTVNGLTAYQLAAEQSNITKYTGISAQGSPTVYWGIRVWVRHENGTETEITAGTPVAVVSRGSSGQGIQSTSWTCPETSLNATDAIIARVYMKIGSGSWNQKSTFTTEQLNATKLEQATWTVCYYTKKTYTPEYHGPGSTNGKFYWGTQTYNSHIQNINYT